MKICVFNSRIKYSPGSDEVILTEKNFHPCHPFFIENEFEPETIKSIRTKGVLETTRYIRHTLKTIDSLLELNGELRIDFFRASFDSGGYPLRPLNYLMNEISICYNDRYKVYRKEFNNNIDTLWLKKLKPSLPPGDVITKWSFGIVSDGKKNDRILSILNQIRGFNIPEYEILICGPRPAEDLPEKVKVLDDSDLYIDVRAPISGKKNRIIENARYNNLIIMHDRISFTEQWYSKICDYGNYFDQLCFPILDEDTHTLRVNDWLKASHDFTLFHKAESGHLDYNSWDRHIYADGGFILIKKHILEKIRFNSFLNWGEMEDVDLSERLYLDGNSVCFYSVPILLSQTHRHKAMRLRKDLSGKLIRPLFSKFKRGLRNKRIMNNFYNFLRKDIS